LVSLKSKVIIVSEETDVNTVLSGVLRLKGVLYYKTTSAEECLSKVKEFEGKIEVVIMEDEIAADRPAMLIVNIKKINPNIKILVIAHEDSNKTRVLDYGADEFALKPMSPENIADKVFSLLASRNMQIR
jgi:DNA-binding NtrC family response regulator